MTRDMDTVKMSYEEMIDTLKGLVFGTFDRTTVKEREALDMAIKALEQDSILEKVRAEIEAQEKWLAEAGCNAYNVGVAFYAIKHALEKRGII